MFFREKHTRPIQHMKVLYIISYTSMKTIQEYSHGRLWERLRIHRMGRQSIIIDI